MIDTKSFDKNLGLPPSACPQAYRDCLFFALGGAFATWPRLTYAQPTMALVGFDRSDVPSICVAGGCLSTGTRETSFEGRNVIVEQHWALHTTGFICRSGPMSALDHKRTFAVQKSMSALPPKADMCGATSDVRFVPIADVEGLLEHFQTNAGVRGRTILISVNSPGVVSTSIEPACCFTMMS